MTSRLLRGIAYIFALLGLVAATLGKLIAEEEEDSDIRQEDAGENL